MHSFSEYFRYCFIWFCALVHHLRSNKTTTTVIAIGRRDINHVSNNAAYGLFSQELDCYGDAGQSNMGAALGSQALNT